MKKLLLLILPFLFFTTKAQITFPAPGADWHYSAFQPGFGGPASWTYTEVKHIKDSLFMGKATKVLGTNISSFTLLGFYTGNTYVYTSNDSVFFYNSQTLNQWQLLYSFNTPVGQSWQIRLQDNNSIDTVNIKVDSVKNTTINSVSLKTLFVTYTEHFGYNPTFGMTYHSVIYDRLGDTTYLLNFHADQEFSCDGCPIMQSILCYQDSTFNLYQPDTSKSCTYSYSGINQFTNNTQIKIYPNPAVNQIFIDANSNDKLTINIYDVNGKQVLNTTINDKSVLDVSTLANGVYTLSLSSVNFTQNKKLIIIK